MTFSEGGKFEGGRVRSRRGGKGAIAGGGIGIAAIAAFLVFQLTGVDITPFVSGSDGGGGGGTVGTVAECTAEEANTDPRCRLSATVQSLDAYWGDVFAASGQELPQPGAEEFTGATTTGCGQATSATGPFYCPVDTSIYLDLGFFEVLQQQFGASGGPLAEMYVVAHEYGHHVQNLTGTLEGGRDAGAESGSVRVELQADCYAGLWAGRAATLVDPDTGVPFLEPITDEQLADAISAAEAVGDDHIQQATQGQVTPHTWTHGSSEQRRRWFLTGYESGDPGACDTFSAAEL